jgi:hypothetical protein
MFRAKVSLLVTAALAWAGFTGCGARTDLGSADALTDAGTAIDAPSPPDAAACSIVGTWAFTYLSADSFYRFLATGQYYGDPTLTGLESAVPVWSGPYTFGADLFPSTAGRMAATPRTRSRSMPHAIARTRGW